MFFVLKNKTDGKYLRVDGDDVTDLEDSTVFSAASIGAIQRGEFTPMVRLADPEAYEQVAVSVSEA